MKEKTIQSTFYEYEAFATLSKQDQDLIKKAQGAAKNAYAPYSNLQMGAAILLENNNLVTGSNQENVAFPSGLCAERVALYYAKSLFPELAIRSVAITASRNSRVAELLPIPCGACLQVLAEYERRQKAPIRILCHGPQKIILGEGVSQFMPLGFRANI